MNLAAWLMSMVAPLVLRAVAALGFTAVTFTGVKGLCDALVATAQSSWSQMPATVLQLASLSGIPEVLGMIFGAVMAMVSLKAAVGFSRYVFKK